MDFQAIYIPRLFMITWWQYAKRLTSWPRTFLHFSKLNFKVAMSYKSYTLSAGLILNNTLTSPRECPPECVLKNTCIYVACNPLRSYFSECHTMKFSSLMHHLLFKPHHAQGLISYCFKKEMYLK